MSSLRAVVVFLSLAAALGAQRIYVVDAQNGPGTHFTDLPPAIAAVPDGSVLQVRAGTYATFLIDGKGLTISGVHRDLVFIANPGPALAIKNTNRNQAVVLQNFTVAATTVAQIDVHDAAGDVVLDTVNVMNASIFATWMEIARCPRVHFHQCDFGGGIQGVFSGGPPLLDVRDSALQLSFTRVAPMGSVSWGAKGTTAISLQNSRLLAVASRITGGDGGFGCIAANGCTITPARGGVAVKANNSQFISLGSWVVGGRGRSTYNQPLSGNGTWGPPYGNGGDATVITLTSAGDYSGFCPIGGPAGGGGANAGQPWVVDGSSYVWHDGNAIPAAATVTGTPAHGRTIYFDCIARPQSSAWLLVSYSNDLLPLEPWMPGSLLANPVLIAGPVTVPALGGFSLPYSIPSAWPLGLTVYGQFVTVEADGSRGWLTNTFPLHVNS